MNVLIIDCFDSFTYNLYQQVGRCGVRPAVITSDAPLSLVERQDPDRIILSPGPGHPHEAGVCLDVLREISPSVPTLGVCLGHQAICVAAGGSVSRAGTLRHGKTSPICHDGQGIFSGIPSPFTATRYHSLAADAAALPANLHITATSRDDHTIMGVQHRKMPIFGVQFHPESILTPCGDMLIQNFLGEEGEGA